MKAKKRSKLLLLNCKNSKCIAILLFSLVAKRDIFHKFLLKLSAVNRTGILVQIFASESRGDGRREFAAAPIQLYFSGSYEGAGWLNKGPAGQMWENSLVRSG